ncbi:MAG: DUF2764 family protein [Mariniphaga sp.]
MNKRKYYYLIAGLPDIIPDDKKLTFSSVQLRNYLQEHLHPADYELVKLFYLPYDHENLVKLLYKEKFEWDERGNYSMDTLEQLADKKQYEMLETDPFPAYLVQFLDIYHDDEEDFPKPEAVKQLTQGWYNHLSSSGNEFVRELAAYRKNMANIMLALNGRKHDIPFEDALIGDDEITLALKKSRSRDFGISNEINDMENIIQIFEMENILDRELRLDSHFWHFLDETTFFNYFTIERILAFVQKLFIAERWYRLDKEKDSRCLNSFWMNYNQILNFLKNSQ